MLEKKAVIHQRFFPNNQYNCEILKIKDIGLTIKMNKDLEKEISLYIPKGVLIYIKDKNKKLIHSPAAKMVKMIKENNELHIDMEWEIYDELEKSKRDALLSQWEE